jgi:hypothetical protein
MGRALSPAKAVLVGHLVVNVPVLVIVALVGFVGDAVSAEVEALGARAGCGARPTAAVGRSHDAGLAERLDLRAH